MWDCTHLFGLERDCDSCKGCLAVRGVWLARRLCEERSEKTHMAKAEPIVKRRVWEAEGARVDMIPIL